MKQRSAVLDNKRSKAYWNTNDELSARAFEAYLISKLQDQNASNDYLANVVSQEAWDAAAAMGLETKTATRTLLMKNCRGCGLRSISSSRRCRPRRRMPVLLSTSRSDSAKPMDLRSNQS